MAKLISVDKSGIKVELDQASENGDIEVPIEYVCLIRKEAEKQKQEELAKQVIRSEGNTHGVVFEYEDLPDGFEVFDEDD